MCAIERRSRGFAFALGTIFTTGLGATAFRFQMMISLTASTTTISSTMGISSIPIAKAKTAKQLYRRKITKHVTACYSSRIIGKGFYTATNNPDATPELQAILTGKRRRRTGNNQYWRFYLKVGNSCFNSSIVGWRPY